MDKEKIIQIVVLKQVGEVALTDKGNLYQLDCQMIIPEEDARAIFGDTIHLIPIKIIKTDG